MTQEGSFSGSPLFMPPEQFVAYSEVDQRADIYALGCVPISYSQAVRPFDGRNPVEVILNHTNKPVVPPSTIVPATPTDLERIVLRCLEKNPNDRFQDVARLERALAACECADQWTEEMAESWWHFVGEPQTSNQWIQRSMTWDVLN